MSFLHLSKNLGLLLTPADHTDVPNAATGCQIVYIYNGDDNLYRKDDSGTVRQLTGAGAGGGQILYLANGSAGPHNSTSSESLIPNTNVTGSTSIPVALYVAGAVFRLTVTGSAITKASSPGTGLFAVLLGSQSLSSFLSAITLPDSVGGKFRLVIEITILNVSGSSDISVSGLLTIQNPTGWTAPLAFTFDGSASGIDLTIDNQALDLQFQFSVADASNEFQTDNSAIFEYSAPA